ncbi:hypothetical protein [Aliamphritea spongicola]|nr:hypothetical protein [Aliamphritea spongicola]
MDSWDGEGADIAISQLAGEMDLDELFSLLFYYGARDFRDIGHKTITVSNSYRLLRLFGDAYAQPVLRSTVYALLNHEGRVILPPVIIWRINPGGRTCSLPRCFPELGRR